MGICLLLSLLSSSICKRMVSMELLLYLLKYPLEIITQSSLEKNKG